MYIDFTIGCIEWPPNAKQVDYWAILAKTTEGRDTEELLAAIPPTYPAATILL
jgi:hypothetical protein